MTRARGTGSALQRERAEARKSPLRRAVEALGEPWVVVNSRLKRGATLEQALRGPRPNACDLKRKRPEPLQRPDLGINPMETSR